MRTLIFLVLIISFVTSKADGDTGTLKRVAEDSPHWTYSGEHGPEHWAELSPDYAACGLGVNQSPIDITASIEANLGDLEIDYQYGTTTIINNGHTLQINSKPGNWLNAEGQRFELQQLHFHSPSEHQLNGESFPLEAHFVHKNEKGELAVVAVVFKEGKINDALETVGRLAPTVVGESNPVDIDFQTLPLYGRYDSYFRYNGSLTTPPCTEGIRWFIIREPGEVAAVQVASFVALIGEDARGPQPQNARIVLRR